MLLRMTVRPTTGGRNVLVEPILDPTGAAYGWRFEPAPDEERELSPTAPEVQEYTNAWLQGRTIALDGREYVIVCFDLIDSTASPQPLRA